MHLKILFIFNLLLISAWLTAQNYTISGYVKDANSGEQIIGAYVYVTDPLKGTTTNHYGFYSLTLPKGSYTFEVSAVGFEKWSQQIILDKNYEINIELKEKTYLIDQIVVTGERSDANVYDAQMGVVKMPVERIKTIPVLFGEVDVIKAIELTPGVLTVGEGSSTYYVRGGGPDQNLILLDEAPVYNANHLMGFFSTFNSDAIQNLELYKSGIPANYGGRISSVLDISMKEGNMRKYQLEGGLGLISSRIAVQGPIKKDTASFIISARRTYADIVMKPFMKTPLGYYFYDINAKANYIISPKDRIFISGYFGRDVFDAKVSDDNFSTNIDWGNATLTARWNHLFSQKLFSNTTFIYSDYNFNFGAKQELYNVQLNTSIRDFQLKSDFAYFLKNGWNMKFGVEGIHHTFKPYTASFTMENSPFNLGNPTKLYAWEAAGYFHTEGDINRWIRISAGVRLGYYQQIGPFTRYLFDPITLTNTDSIVYGKFKKVVDYYQLEPRFLVRFKIDSTSSIKLSATRNTQFIHMVSPVNVTLPTDLWIPSTDSVKPQIGYQVSLGYFRNFFDNSIEFSIEGYYKWLFNQIDYKEESLYENYILTNLDNNFTYGKGRAYGIELFLQKKYGTFTGWIGYSYGKTEREFPKINDGKPFPAKYDRTHDISIVLTYRISNAFSLSGVWVFATGNTATVPVSRYFIEGNIVTEYSDRNAFRLPSYHRADISLTWYPQHKKKSRKIEESWNLSIYNVYNRKNPYVIYFDINGDMTQNNMTITAKQLSLFPILPSITWNFKF